eukprot:4771415-Amphidinium_carterae.1
MSGLQHLHQNNHIHRDIKPQNVLHNSAGEVKLTDFGIAKELGTMGLACTFVGTAMYMAPERCLGKDYSVNSDIWSLGMVLHELAIGKYPFDATSFPVLVDCLCERPEPRLESALFPVETVDFLAHVDEAYHGDKWLRQGKPAGLRCLAEHALRRSHVAVFIAVVENSHGAVSSTGASGHPSAPALFPGTLHVVDGQRGYLKHGLATREASGEASPTDAA